MASAVLLEPTHRAGEAYRLGSVESFHPALGPHREADLPFFATMSTNSATRATAENGLIRTLDSIETEGLPKTAALLPIFPSRWKSSLAYSGVREIVKVEGLPSVI